MHWVIGDWAQSLFGSLHMIDSVAKSIDEIKETTVIYLDQIAGSFDPSAVPVRRKME